MSFCCLLRLCALPRSFNGYCVYCETCLTLILRDGDWKRG